MPADPAHPDVPLAPGVPKLASHAPSVPDTLVKQDSADAARLAAQGWGIYTRGGALALDPDNIMSVGSSVDYRIADYPMEAGEYGTYNKVATPVDVRVAMTKGGPLADRTAFRETVGHMQGDLELYNVVTPTITYLSVNVTRVEQDQSAESGAGVIKLLVSFREIRETGSIEYAEDDTGDTVNNESGVPKKTPNSPTTTPKKPVVKTPRSPAAARRRSSGAAQPKTPSRLDDAALRRQGFVKQPNGDYVYYFTDAEKARANRPL